MRIAEPGEEGPELWPEARFRAAGGSVRQVTERLSPPVTEPIRRRLRRRRMATGVLTVLVLASGIGTAVLQQRRGRSWAIVEMSGATVAEDRAPVRGFVHNWRTKTVAFAAQELRIHAGGHVFTAQVGDVRVDSDPGWSEYTTLEVTWREHDVLMRLNMYFRSDGTDWWIDEVRTYNGRPKPDWIRFDGRYGRVPRGMAFAGDLRLGEGDGMLEIRGLRLQAFAPAVPCEPSGTDYRVYPLGDDRMAVTTSPRIASYSIPVKLVDTACGPVEDLSPFSFTWTLGDPALAHLGTNGPCAPGSDTGGCIPYLVALKPVAVGETDLRVEVRRKADGVLVAETAIHLIITAG
jgi:hypothetical protein